MEGKRGVDNKNRFEFINRRNRTSHGAVLVACLLIGIRLAAGTICTTCFNEFEQPPVRSFHLHGGGDHEGCHHGRAQTSPLVGWACTANQDDPAFVLPETLRLPILISQFIPWILFLVIVRDLFLIAAVGRGPPSRAS